MDRDERVDEIIQLLSEDPEALEVLLRLARRLANPGNKKAPDEPKSDLTT